MEFLIGIIIVFILFAISPKLRIWLEGGSKGLKEYEEITGEKPNTLGGNKMEVSQDAKFKLVVKFAQERMNKLDFNEDLSLLSETQLLGLPECNIVTLVEIYYLLKKRGISHNDIINEMNEQRSSFDSNPTPLEANLSLKDFIYNRLEIELPQDAGFHIGENGFSIQHINNVIDSSANIYNLS
tara:strand:+ start:280 stop:828 length:549 start_codon:yes stop_codon:yes gene_type:complete